MLNLLQAADAAPEASLLQQFQPFVLIGVMVLVMWLLVWRPESKRRKDQAKFRDALKKGDKIVTAGGIYGVVKEVKETTLVIEIDNNVNIRIDKAMVVADPSTVAAPQKK